MMDNKNLFVSRNIYYYNRLDYIVLLISCLILIYYNWGDFNSISFILMLVWPELGFYPAAFWYFFKSDSDNRSVPEIFYYIYNISHGVVANLSVILIWMYIADGFQWAMLAFPVHLGIDRGLFGLFYKSRKISFIPKEHPDYSVFKKSLEVHDQ